jgi:hypothetical protein
MATTYKEQVAQGTASTGTYSTLYSTGAGVTAVCQLMISNESSSVVTVRVGLADSAGTPSRFRLYDVVVAGNDTLSFGPINMAASRFLRVSSSANTCTFWGDVAEIS